VSWYKKGKTNLDFTEATDSEWQQHQLGYMQVHTSLQIDNHARTPPLSFLQTCPSFRPTNNVKALKATKRYLSQNLLAAHTYTLKIVSKIWTRPLAHSLVTCSCANCGVAEDCADDILC